MNVIVCGSRHWTDVEAIRRELSLLLDQVMPQDRIVATYSYQSFASQITIIHGDCRGADQIAGKIANEIGLVVAAVPADWNAHGRSAGPRRNQQMLNALLKHDGGKLVLAFHEDLGKSRGTKDMIQRALAAGIPVKIIPKPKAGGYGARLTRMLQP